MPQPMRRALDPTQGIAGCREAFALWCRESGVGFRECGSMNRDVFFCRFMQMPALQISSLHSPRRCTFAKRLTSRAIQVCMYPNEFPGGMRKTDCSITIRRGEWARSVEPSVICRVIAPLIGAPRNGENANCRFEISDHYCPAKSQSIPTG